MDTAALKEYLGMVVDLEKHIFLQEKIIARVRYELERLSKPTVCLKPEEPQKPIKASAPGESAVSIGRTVCTVLIGGFAAWYGATAVCMTIAAMFGGMGSAIIFLGFIPPVLVAVNAIKKYNAAQEEYQRKVYIYMEGEKEKERRYEQAKADYQRALSDSVIAHKKSEQKREDMLAFWNVELIRAQAICEETKGRLRAVYEKDIIFPKYRNLVMVSSIYEYLCAGRCTTLDGHEGAYNILETEIRLDQIIVQLDRVIANLEKIQQNQYILYSAIQESNAQSARLLESTDRMAQQLQTMQSQNALQGEALNAQIKELQKSSELTAYHAERTQKELAYMNRMDYLTGRNDGPFRNVPPT